MRDVVHGIALYTFPAALSGQTRARLLAAIAGPERLTPFAQDLAALMCLPQDHARELLARVDTSRGWHDDAGLRILPIEIGPGSEVRVPEDMSDPPDPLDVTVVQRPSWPRRLIVRAAPGATIPSRYPHSEARVLVLQGGLSQDDARAAGPGDLIPWPSGTTLGVADPGGPELILAVLNQ